MGGNFTSNQTLRTKGAPPKLRASILARDHHTCQMNLACCTTRAEEVDHIIPVFEGGTDDPTNLRSVCKACHKIKTQHEAQRAKPHYSRKRPPKPHPGLLENQHNPPHTPHHR